MAGEINFGLLDPNAPAKVGNAFYQGQQEAQQQQTAQTQNKLMQLSLGEKQQAFDRQNKLLSIMNGLGPGATDEQRVSALQGGGYFDEADKLRNDALNRQRNEADLNSTNFKLKIDKQHQAIADIAALPNVEAALAGLDAHLKNGDIDQQKYDAVKATLPADPTKFGEWKTRMIMGILSPKDRAELNKPVIQTRDTGGTLETIQIDPGTGTVTTLNSIKKTQSPDSRAAGERKAAENGPLDENGERTAQAIASGQLPPPTGMALLNPKNQRILGRVMEINPQYDATTVSAKKKAASDFTTGQLGNSMRSFAVAGQHLDQLNSLVDAMDNGNMQLVNKISNAYSQQTGSPAVTNFDAAKDVVSKEVVKAIVAGGGGVAEREELSKLMDNAKSPAQLKGVIQQYRSLMAAQHDALLQQRRAAGLSDSTLPSYTDASGSPNKTSSTPQTNAKGWALHVDAKGNKAYVSPDGKQFEEVQ